MHSQTIVELAEMLIRLSDEHGVTPVLVCDKSIRLKPTFYENLANEVLRVINRPVRLEVLVSGGQQTNWLGDWRANSLVRALRKCSEPQAGSHTTGQITIERRLMLSRSAGLTRPLAIGIAAPGIDLPEWAKPIEFTTRPTQTTQIQVVAA